ncbi:MAG: hypothetical protein JXM73_16015 [Anaerolineae bacterium]|nr:hypothetical protein [Anaerolineae bacterium]
MKRNKHPGLILLSVWLILTGLFALLNLSFTGSGAVLAILGIIAALAILLQGRRLPARTGMLVLSIWLILAGLLTLTGLSFAGSGVVLAVLALAAGILILLNR